MQSDELTCFLPANDVPFEIQPWQVARILSRVRENMAVPAGQLPIRLLKEFSVELAIPPPTYSMAP